MRPFVLFLLLPACMGHVRIRYLEPAAIDLPPSIQVIAPIDRVGNVHSSMAMEELEQELARSPRVKVVHREAAQKAWASQPVIVEAQLPPNVTKGICAATNASGIVALENLKTTDWSTVDRRIEKRQDEEKVTDAQGNTTTRILEQEVEVYRVDVQVDSLAAWRTYTCDGTVVDASETSGVASGSGEGSSESEARHLAPKVEDLAPTTVRQAGFFYAHHIAPFEVEADRRFYKTGSKRLKNAAARVAAGDWDRAREIWEKVSKEEGKKKIQGKALYNLALASERAGDLAQAIEYARQADDLLSNKKTSSYLDLLRQRRKADRKVRQQMEPVPAD